MWAPAPTETPSITCSGANFAPRHGRRKHFRVVSEPKLINIFRKCVLYGHLIATVQTTVNRKEKHLLWEPVIEGCALDLNAFVVAL